MKLSLSKLLAVLHGKHLALTRVYATLSGDLTLLELKDDATSFVFMAVLPTDVRLQPEFETTVVLEQFVHSCAQEHTNKHASTHINSNPNTPVFEHVREAVGNMEKIMLSRYMSQTLQPDEATKRHAVDLDRQLSRISLIINDKYTAALTAANILSLEGQSYRLAAELPAVDAAARRLFLVTSIHEVLSSNFRSATLMSLYREIIRCLIDTTAQNIRMLERVVTRMVPALECLNRVHSAVKVLQDEVEHSVERTCVNALLCNEKIVYENTALLSNIVANIDLLDTVLNSFTLPLKP
jgi:hypothetical protein